MLDSFIPGSMPVYPGALSARPPPSSPRRPRAADSFPKRRNHVFTARTVAVRLAASAAAPPRSHPVRLLTHGLTEHATVRARARSVRLPIAQHRRDRAIPHPRCLPRTPSHPQIPLRKQKSTQVSVGKSFSASSSRRRRPPIAQSESVGHGRDSAEGFLR